MIRLNSIDQLQSLREEISKKRDSNRPCIAICSGTACNSTGSQRVYEALEESRRKSGLEREIDIKRKGCHGPAKKLDQDF